jgi:hypothetical protein
LAASPCAATGTGARLITFRRVDAFEADSHARDFDSIAVANARDAVGVGLSLEDCPVGGWGRVRGAGECAISDGQRDGHGECHKAND